MRRIVVDAYIRLDRMEREINQELKTHASVTNTSADDVILIRRSELEAMLAKGEAVEKGLHELRLDIHNLVVEKYRGMEVTKSLA
ncbi:MAG: hypothetical protein HYY22_07800 [Thaumarchaeota archaeon]|nr:hypothetical protein [Nitrososphaerota archaeon]